jgi:threonyl-tRNA synthetase
MLVCGDKEMEAGEIAVRTRKGVDLGKFKVTDLVDKLRKEISTRILNIVEE